MIAVSLRLLAGHYHATPWGRHVNEGEVEWPPSPWRLLRALLATWHAKAREVVDETLMRRLVTHLADALPEYRLPAASLAHTRHFMPLYNSSRDGKTAKVIDTFACVNCQARIGIVWPDLELDNNEVAALVTLLERVGYLGRAESWAELKLVEEIPEGQSCHPLNGDEECEAVKVLAPMPGSAYAHWRREFCSNGSHPARNGKATPVPTDVWEALHVDTGDLRAAGWSDPPGSRWVLYGRPRGSRDSRPMTGGARLQTVLPRVARFVVASSVAPGFVNGLLFAEKLHKCLVELACRHERAVLPVLTGKDEQGEVLQGHRHAYILWESNESQRRTITHVTLYAPEGFAGAAMRVLERVRLLYGARGHDVQLVLLGLGQPQDFAGLELSAGQCPLFAESRTWVSRTPFVPTRHPKCHGRGSTAQPRLDSDGLQVGSPDHDLLRLLALSGLPRPKSTPIDGTPLEGRVTGWRSFSTTRYSGDGRRGDARGYGFRLEFPEPVRGPLAVGYGAHFGLGTFWPEGVLDT